MNARGAQLTAADLIKNFIFQRLLESGADVETAYERHWRDFESAFWEAEISLGRPHWPLLDGTRDETERDALIHTLGNLTLLTSKLNTKVSNGPWLGESGKRHGLEAHDVLLLNRELVRTAGEHWTDSSIRSRSEELAKAITESWPAPAGHRSGFGREKVRVKHKIDLSDLISAGRLQTGMQLFPRSKKFAASVATLLLDGRLDVLGTVYSSPSEAARAIVGANMSGWHFFLIDRQSRRSLKDVRLDYLESIAADFDEHDSDDDPEEI